MVDIRLIISSFMIMFWSNWSIFKFWHQKLSFKKKSTLPLSFKQFYLEIFQSPFLITHTHTHTHTQLFRKKKMKPDSLKLLFNRTICLCSWRRTLKGLSRPYFLETLNTSVHPGKKHLLLEKADGLSNVLCFDSLFYLGKNMSYSLFNV